MANKICDYCDQSFPEDDMKVLGDIDSWFCHGCWQMIEEQN